jgi:hypothetical protein
MARSRRKQTIAAWPWYSHGSGGIVSQASSMSRATTPSIAASGGPFARPLLPGLWRTIGGVLPPGASVDLARSALFFNGARIAGPVLVLVGWAVLGTSLVLALGGRIMNPVDVEAEAAAGAAV